MKNHHILEKIDEDEIDLYSQMNAELTLKDAKNVPGLSCKDIVNPKFENVPLAKFAVVPPFLYVPQEDENTRENQKEQLAGQLVAWGLEKLPVVDINSDCSSRQDAIDSAYEYFGAAVPEITVKWREPTSDEALTLIAFQGLGSHRIERVERPDIEAHYMIDLTWMRAYPVRENFEAYGSIAYFDSERKPVGIFEPKLVV